MNKDFVILGRQPILDRQRKIIGYELLFRDHQGAAGATIPENLTATARVLVNSLDKVGAKHLLGDKLAFVNVDHDFISTDLIAAMPHQHFVFEILEHSVLEAYHINKIRELKSKGYRFALDDFIFSDESMRMFQEVFPLIDILKVDLKGNPLKEITSKTHFMKRYGFSLLIEKVETEEEFRMCLNLGYDYFQGFFFAKPTIVKGVNLDPEKSAVLELMAVLQQDGEVGQIVTIFNRYPALGVQLLKLINSAGLGPGQKIDSIQHAVNMIGRRRLMNWLLLLAFAGGDEQTSNPLLELAATRAQFLTKYIGTVQIDLGGGKLQALEEQAFLVGLLSFIDVLFGRPMEELLGELGISDDLTAAILHRTGLLGEGLAIIAKMESNELKAEDLQSSGLDFQKLAALNEQSFQWVKQQGF